MKNCTVKLEVYFSDIKNELDLNESDFDKETDFRKRSETYMRDQFFRYIIKKDIGKFEIENFDNRTIEKFLLSDDLLEKEIKMLDEKIPKYDNRYLTFIVKVSDLYNIIFSPEIIKKFAELNLEINLELRS